MNDKHYSKELQDEKKNRQKISHNTYIISYIFFKYFFVVFNLSIWDKSRLYIYCVFEIGCCFSFQIQLMASYFIVVDFDSIRRI